MQIPFYYTLQSDVVYKNLRLEHAQEMVEHGKVKVGTLHYYRKQEVGIERQDEMEGVRTTLVGERLILGDHLDDLHPVARSIVEQSTNALGASGTFIGCLFVHREVGPDYYTYCVSERFTEENMLKYGGACVEIRQPREFFRELSECLVRERKLTAAAVGKCHYLSERELMYDNYDKVKRIPPCFIKPARYSNDWEARAVWESSSSDIDWLYVSCPRIMKYCSLYKSVQGTQEQVDIRNLNRRLEVESKPSLNLDEASLLTGLSRSVLHHAIKRKELKAKIIGREWCVKRTDLDTYITKL